MEAGAGAMWMRKHGQKKSPLRSGLKTQKGQE